MAEKSGNQSRIRGKLVAASLLAGTFPASMICGFPALHLLEGNAEYFGSGVGAVRLVFYLATVLSLFVALCGVFRKTSFLPGIIFWSFIIFGFLWPLVGGLRQFLEPGLALGMVSFVSILAGGGLLRLPNIGERAIVAAAFLGGGFLIWLGAESVKIARIGNDSKNSEIDDPAISQAATKRWSEAEPYLPDVYHIVLDEFQTDFFNELLTDQLREQLSGFQFFPEATTPYGRTEFALSSVFSGIPFNYKEEPLDYMIRAFHGGDSLLAELKRTGYWTVGFLHAVYPKNTPSPFDETYFHRDRADLTHDSGRDGLFLSLWLYSTLPASFARPMIAPHRWEQLQSQILLPEAAPYLSLQSFRKLIAAERQPEGSGPKYVFAHLILPHFPAVLGSDCEFCDEGTTTQIDQAACTIKTVVEFVQALKESGKFRRTLILVHGDHGARHYMRNGELVRAEGGFYSTEWSWGRSRPLLLVKPAGVDGENTMESDLRPADLYDLYPTILDSAGIDGRVPLFGESLLQEPGGARTRYYHFYDKDRQAIVDGTLKRYVFEQGQIAFDREITIER